jgi:hypothetical protein
MLALTALAACTSGTIVGSQFGDVPPVDTGASADDDDAEVAPGTGTDDPKDPEADEDDEIYLAFFDPAVIQQVDIELSEEAMYQLNYVDGRTYVEGSITVNGERFDAVGVRFKGSSTYQDLDCSDGYCKAAFKIKLNAFVEGQKLGDIQRITLNNMVSDYTQSKEVIAYNIMVDQSFLASRCNYATVTLNGQNWGLYANLESADDRWVKRRFEDASGNFWSTGNGYADFRPEWFDTGWSITSGEGDYTQLAALASALDRYQGDYFGELGEVMNAEQFLDYWAWCAAIGNYDGYPWHLNDILLYEDPLDARKFVFAPWGIDESWDEYEYTGQTWNTVYGRLGYACLDDPACIEELRVRIGIALDEYDEADVLSRAQAAWDLSEEAVQADPVRPYTPDYVWYYRDYYEGVMPGYSDYVRTKVGL